jgi:hypothetical protein
MPLVKRLSTRPEIIKTHFKKQIKKTIFQMNNFLDKLMPLVKSRLTRPKKIKKILTDKLLTDKLLTDEFQLCQ